MDGAVGLTVARAAGGLGMELLAYDPYANPSLAAAANVELLSSMDELLEQADFLTIHTPMIASTKGIIGAAELSKMKPSARILNVARGGIVETVRRQVPRTLRVANKLLLAKDRTNASSLSAWRRMLRSKRKQIYDVTLRRSTSRKIIPCTTVTSRGAIVVSPGRIACWTTCAEFIARLVREATSLDRQDQQDSRQVDTEHGGADSSVDTYSHDSISSPSFPPCSSSSPSTLHSSQFSRYASAMLRICPQA